MVPGLDRQRPETTRTVRHARDGKCPRRAATLAQGVGMPSYCEGSDLSVARSPIRGLATASAGRVFRFSKPRGKSLNQVQWSDPQPQMPEFWWRHVRLRLELLRGLSSSDCCAGG